NLAIGATGSNESGDRRLLRCETAGRRASRTPSGSSPLGARASRMPLCAILLGQAHRVAEHPSSCGEIATTNKERSELRQGLSPSEWQLQCGLKRCRFEVVLLSQVLLPRVVSKRCATSPCHDALPQAG